MKQKIDEESLLIQETYLHELEANPERNERVRKIAHELSVMDLECMISICIPAYREASLIRNTLLNYTIHQIATDGKLLDPSLFEVNILINRPNDFSERDMEMLDVIDLFRAEYPAYHINVAEVLYDFPDKAVMGLIFKDIADATILRNIARTIPDEKKSRLVIRTAGADVEALNPHLLSRTIEIFSDETIVAHR